MSVMSTFAKLLEVSLAADAHCAYVSETVTFWVRVRTAASLAGGPVRVGMALPSVFNLTTATEAQDLKPEHGLLSDGSHEVTWTLTAQTPPTGEDWATTALQVQAVVRQVYAPAFREFLQTHRVRPDRERALHVRVDAWARAALAQDDDHTVIAVRIMSRQASYLPSLYRQEDNDLLGRFLMSGDRHWQRNIVSWLDNADVLADPLLAPAHVLAWLGSWADEPEDERWPLRKRRQLLAQAMRLRRWRGTRKALSDHIALYTGLPPTITEHRASQLQVGQAARLGMGVVLGSEQTPHMFSVAASLSPSHASDGIPAAQHEQVIRDIIEAEKPAHTRLKELTVTWASA